MGIGGRLIDDLLSELRVISTIEYTVASPQTKRACWEAAELIEHMRSMLNIGSDREKPMRLTRYQWRLVAESFQKERSRSGQCEALDAVENAIYQYVEGEKSVK